MLLNKKTFSEMLGLEVNEASISYMGLDVDGRTLNIHINVQPKVSLKFINVEFTILPTGAKFNED